MNVIASALRSLAVRDARLESLYRRFVRPNGIEWAKMLRERGDFYAMGEHCSTSSAVKQSSAPMPR